jgi:hypothetical protein
MKGEQGKQSTPQTVQQLLTSKRSLDLTMTSLFNSRDREAGEWGPLFEKADSRLQFKGIQPCSMNKTGLPTKKLLSLIEATWVE